MEVVGYLIVIAVGFAAGYLANQYIAPSAKKIAELEEALEKRQQEMLQYRESVAGHFAKSSKMFGELTQGYRSLYEHLSEGAHELCDRRSIPRELATSHVNILSVESPELAPKLSNKSAEPQASSEEMSEAPTGVLTSADERVVDVTRDGMSPFDHDVESLERTKRRSRIKKVDDSAEIIDLDSQRTSGDVEQAKDYAIKDKGVINHNSLNRDDVQT